MPARSAADAKGEDGMRKALYMFGILDDSDLEWLSKSGSTRFLEAGKTIITQGEPVGSLFIVLT